MTARLSTKGQLVIPTRIRKAMSLEPGDQLELTLEGRRLVVERRTPRRAKRTRGRFGRVVLIAPPGAPRMTTATVVAARDDQS